MGLYLQQLLTALYILNLTYYGGKKQNDAIT
jgi:hypothetical protein